MEKADSPSAKWFATSAWDLVGKKAAEMGNVPLDARLDATVDWGAEALKGEGFAESHLLTRFVGVAGRYTRRPRS